MTEKCVGCEKDFIVCTHNVCGEDKGNCLITHASCDAFGCGLCMNGCSGSPDEEYCDDCLNEYAVDGHADSYTRRMENGWTE